MSAPQLVVEGVNIITERPSSRGGMAFEIIFDDRCVFNCKKIPSSLQKKQKGSNLTKELLQSKIDAAEQRRKVN